MGNFNLKRVNTLNLDYILSVNLQPFDWTPFYVDGALKFDHLKSLAKLEWDYGKQ